MSLERWFRLVHHATLGWAGVCLTLGERDFLPGSQWLLIPYLGLLALAAGLEGRWVLPITGANIVGAVIAGGFVTWVIVETHNAAMLETDFSFTSGLVPQVGPLLMALLAVQAFRPRTRGNFWLLQGLGLLQVALGCVLAVGSTYSGLVAIYLALLPVCLVLHYLYREKQGSLAGLPPIGETGWHLRLPWSIFLIPFTLRWVVTAGAAGLALFLCLPRGEGQAWDPRTNFGNRYFEPLPKAQTGFGETIDLHRTGTVEVNEDEAFTVRAVGPDGQTPAELPADLRWRGTVLDRYQGGVWKASPRNPPLLRSLGQLPPLGPERRLLTITIQPRKAGGLFLVDPILTEPGMRTAVAMLVDRQDKQALPIDELTGTTPWPVVNRLFPYRREFKYRQVLGPSGGSDLHPAVPTSPEYQGWLLAYDVPSLQEWTTDLLKRLVRERRYGLVAGDVTDGQVPMPRWEAAARALNRYLANSGEYTYTLDLRVQDPTLDPVLDFLKNVKQGHCERYATALALMLRSQGIPARIVKGFRGNELQEEGVYVVRQSHAHSWVEALVPGEEGGSYWLTLDPTPSDDAPVKPSFSLARWLEESRRSLVGLWQGLILDYNAEQQYETGQVFVRLLRNGWKERSSWLPGFAGLLALGLIAWQGQRLFRGIRRRRRVTAARKPPIVVAFYARLLGLLEQHCQLRPLPEQTAREFAQQARQALLEHPATASLAELPGRVARLFYRVRFGAGPLTNDEAQDLSNQLDRLAAAFPLAAGQRLA